MNILYSLKVMVDRGHSLRSLLFGIAIDKEGVFGLTLDDYVSRLSWRTGRLLGLDIEVGREQIDIRHGSCAAGYGIAGELEREAIALAAAQEAILLDPVYTGRAMGLSCP